MSLLCTWLTIQARTSCTHADSRDGYPLSTLLHRFDCQCDTVAARCWLHRLGHRHAGRLPAPHPPGAGCIAEHVFIVSKAAGWCVHPGLQPCSEAGGLWYGRGPRSPGSLRCPHQREVDTETWSTWKGQDSPKCCDLPGGLRWIQR